MRLYLDTSVFGALLDREMPQRVEITRDLLGLIIDGSHTGIISNIVLEEIERAPEEIRERLLAEISHVPFQIILEDEASANLFKIPVCFSVSRKSRPPASDVMFPPSNLLITFR